LQKKGADPTSVQSREIRINYRIRAPQVRVIGAKGEQLGVMTSEEAIRRAQEGGLDLVEVAGAAAPPVCRIMDFSKYKYDQEKKEREARKKQHIVHIKEIKFNPKISENDYQVKLRHIKDFLSTGDLGSARKLLNRHYDVKGVVVHGNKIGHKLGYPTANIDYGNYFLPKSGVYYVKVSFDGETHHAMANIGNNPTLNYSFEKRLEIYILDFKQNIYGKTLDITFMHYLRTELKFRNKKELIEQLQKDETAVRKLII